MIFLIIINIIYTLSPLLIIFFLNKDIQLILEIKRLEDRKSIYICIYNLIKTSWNKVQKWTKTKLKTIKKKVGCNENIENKLKQTKFKKNYKI